MIIFAGIGGIIALLLISFVLRNFWIIAILLAIAGVWLYIQQQNYQASIVFGDPAKVELRNTSITPINTGTSGTNLSYRIKANLKNNLTEPMTTFSVMVTLNSCADSEQADDEPEKDSTATSCEIVGSGSIINNLEIPPGQVRSLENTATFNNVANDPDRTIVPSIKIGSIILHKH